MYPMLSIFIADGFFFFLVIALEMDDRNIFSDKMSPHQKVLPIHLLVDSRLQCPSVNCMYAVKSLLSVSTFLFF
jgi:hypothetical protein